MALESLQARILHQLERQPGRPALAWGNRRGEFVWRTAEETALTAARMAGALAAAGLGSGQVCLIVMPSVEQCGQVLLGALWRGALPLLIAPPVMQGFNPTLLRTLRHVIRKTKPAVLVMPESMTYLRGLLARQGQPRVLVAESDLAEEALPGAMDPVLPARDSVAALQLTSGTTGLPKACVWSQSNVLAAIDGMQAAMKLSSEDVCFNWTPLYHDMGLVNNFFVCMATGTPLAMLNPTDFIRNPALWLRGLHATGATITWSPNFGFAVCSERVTDQELAGVRLDRVRGFWNAAERIHYETMLAFQRRFGPYGVRPEALKTNFGCAENVGGATFSDPDGPFRAERLDVRALQAGRAVVTEQEPSTWVVSTGRPYPGLRVSVLSARGEVLPEGRVGRVALSSPSAMQGYLGQSRETRQALRGDVLLTGDLGYLRDGELFWTGRTRERIKVRGRSLDPSDFETALLEVPDLRKGCFAAFGVDDAAAGTQRIIVVSELVDEPARGYGAIAAAVRERVSQHLGLTPSEVVLVPKGSLTKTSSGKRRHRHFKRLYLQGALPSLYSSKEAAA